MQRKSSPPQPHIFFFFPWKQYCLYKALVVATAPCNSKGRYGRHNGGKMENVRIIGDVADHFTKSLELASI